MTAPAPRITVLVPAHDEELLITRCVRSLLEQTYPADAMALVVVADNCSDGTASVAAAAGARVLVRNEPGLPGKGRALRWAMDCLLAERPAPDAVAVVDADSVADHGLVAGLASALQAGHDAVQGDYTLLEASGAGRADMASVGFLLFHRVRFRGRARLGLSANLVGNGMLLSTRLLRRHPWSAFTGVEDLEYSLSLRRAGVRPFFAASAMVAGPAPASGAGATRQRARWEGGRFHVVRSELPALVVHAVAHRDGGALDAALDLATPPLSALVLLAASGLGMAAALASAGLVAWWGAFPWALAVVEVPAFVVLGLVSAGASQRLRSVMLRAPSLVAWKLVTYVRIARGHDVNAWDRSDRVAL